MFQDVIVEILADRLRQCSNAKGIVINGFPRSIVQLGDLDKLVGFIPVMFTVLYLTFTVDRMYCKAKVKNKL